MYILRRDDGYFATPPGRRHSYSQRLQDARVFPSLEAAKSEACANEAVISVRDLYDHR